MDFNNVSYEIFNSDMFRYKIYCYFGLWMIKILCQLIMKIIICREKTSKFACYFILFWQRIHFAAYCLLSCDIIFLGVRTLFHTKLDWNLVSKI